MHRPIVRHLPRPRHIAAKMHNRHILLAALNQGLRVVSEWGSHYFIPSASEPNYLYDVQVTEDGITLSETCTCLWSQSIGPVETYNRGTTCCTINVNAPCKHIMITHWRRLEIKDRIAAIEADPDLRSAVIAGAAIASKGMA